MKRRVSASAVRFPGVDQSHAGPVEVPHIAGGHRKAACGCNRSDGAIRKADRIARCSGAGMHGRVRACGRYIKGQDAPLEQRQHLLLQRERQRRAALACRQRGHARQQFGQGDAAEVQGLRALVVQPGQHRGIGPGFHWLRHHVGVQQDHLKLAGAAGVLSRASFNSTPPTLRPMAASVDPSPCCARTASSRMWRISASVLRPCCAARCLSARWVASGRFRTVTDDIWTALWKRQQMISICLFDCSQLRTLLPGLMAVGAWK
mmetsp:Transcript_70450/g.166017  ORF Transcript_70450/g.166017 Transcript_70450/m.166017 type:complete len:262 (+) Transcript_70450:1629-2414(+)